MSRRLSGIGGRRDSARDGGSVLDPYFYGVSSFSATDWYRDPATFPTTRGPFQSAPFSGACLFHLDSTDATAAIHCPAGHGNTNGNGGSTIIGTLSNLKATVMVAAARYDSPTVSQTANKTYLLGWTLTSGTNGTLRLYDVNGEVGSGTATTGTYDTPTVTPSIGNRWSAGEPFALGPVAGFGGCDATLSAAQMQSWLAQCKAAVDMVSPPAGTNKWVWSVKQTAMRDSLTPAEPWAPNPAGDAASLDFVADGATLTIDKILPDWAA